MKNSERDAKIFLNILMGYENILGNILDSAQVPGIMNDQA